MEVIYNFIGVINFFDSNLYKFYLPAHICIFFSLSAVNELVIFIIITILMCLFGIFFDKKFRENWTY